MENTNHNLKAGVDYFVNDRVTLTYTSGANISNNGWYSEATSSNLNALRQPLTEYFSINDEYGEHLTIGNSLNYSHKLDTAGQELTVDLMHTYVKGDSEADMRSSAYDPTGAYMEALSLHRQTNTLTGIHNMVMQTVSVYFFKKGKVKGHKIDAGLKTETTVNDNVFDAFRVLNNVAAADSLLSNKFNYTENIGAIYTSYSGSFKKFSWTGGLRGEHTYIKSNNNSVNRRYFSLFPNVSFSYAFSEANNTSISYSRRVQRPQFRQLNNTVSYIDQYSTWQGNPLLQPSFTDILSISHSLMVKQHMFVFEAIGQLQQNDFIESSWVDSNRISRGGNINGADRQLVALNVYFKIQLTKWWDVQMNHNYSYSHYAYAEGINTGSISGHSYNLWAATSFKFWKNTTLEVNGWFNSRGVGSQGPYLPVGVLNASIKKTFLKDKLTVSIAGRNLLESMKWRWQISNTDLKTNGSWHNIDRVLMFTVSYQLGGKVTPRQTQGNDRLGGGGGGGR